MGLLDFVLNVTGLLLWFAWCTARFDPLAHATARTLVGTLKPAAPVRFRRWPLLVGIVVLLLVRALFYWEVGPPVDWNPILNFGAVVLPFKSVFFIHVLVFSVLSFVRTLVIVYLWLIFLWAIAPLETRENPTAKLIKLYLGRITLLPAVVQVLVPFIVSVGLWLTVEPVLGELGITSPVRSGGQLLVHAMLVSVSGYLTLRWIIAFLLLVYLVDTYVYMGKRPALDFGISIGGRLLRPLRKLPVRFRKVDLAPAVGIAIVYMIGEAILAQLPRLYLP